MMPIGIVLGKAMDTRSPNAICPRSLTFSLDTVEAIDYKRNHERRSRRRTPAPGPATPGHAPRERLDAGPSGATDGGRPRHDPELGSRPARHQRPCRAAPAPSVRPLPRRQQEKETAMIPTTAILTLLWLKQAYPDDWRKRWKR